jgi:hypothetical protein
VCVCVCVCVCVYVIRPTTLDADGHYVLAQPFRCHLLSIGYSADAPARAALMNTFSHASYLGCQYCFLTQVSLSKHRRVFMGYSKPSEVTRGPLSGQLKQMVRAQLQHNMFLLNMLNAFKLTMNFFRCYMLIL